MKKILVCLVMISVLAMAGCKAKQTQTKETKMPEAKSGLSEPKVATVDATKKYTAIIKTAKGEIALELYPKDAPISVTNFKQLADAGYYKGLVFHRVVPGFVIQGGDPTGTGSGGPGYTTAAEIKLPHKKGALAWARTGDAVNPARRSSGSQFYITLEATPFLDGQYTVFGQTTTGMDVVEKIAPGDKIESVDVKVE